MKNCPLCKAELTYSSINPLHTVLIHPHSTCVLSGQGGDKVFKTISLAIDAARAEGFEEAREMALELHPRDELIRAMQQPKAG